MPRPSVENRGSSFYYIPTGVSPLINLILMRLIDEAFLECPFYGARQMPATGATRAITAYPSKCEARPRTPPTGPLPRAIA